MIAFLFPGQGSQRPQLLRDSLAAFDAGTIFDEASEIVGTDVLLDDEEPALMRTEIVQRNVFLAGVAGARALERTGTRAQAVAGHSVGAFAAATIAGALSFADALRLVELRGASMARAFGAGYEMAAILGMTEPRVARVIADSAATDGVFIATVNAPDQIVVAGMSAAVRRVAEIARERGARDVRTLAVVVPSHTPMLLGVRDELAAAVDRVPFDRPKIGYSANIDGRPLFLGAEIARDLVESVALPVRWHDATQALFESGARCFVETFLGDALTNLCAAAFPTAIAISLATTTLASTARRCQPLTD